MSSLVPELALVSSAAASWPVWWRVVTELAYFLTLASVIGGTLTYLAVVRPVVRATEMGIIMTQTHIVAGCTWVGGLAGLVLLSRTRPALGTHAALFWARIWQRFSVLALTAVAR